jgi:hypothetical protein
MESEEAYLVYAHDIKKVVKKYKDIENDFYSNDSLNNDLDSRI